MKKLFNERGKYAVSWRRHDTSPQTRLVVGDRFPQVGPECLAAVSENLRLKKILKRAVEKDYAPFHLIDSIRSRIRSDSDAG